MLVLRRRWISCFSALALALTLPDICRMIEYPNENTVSKRYINWYDQFMGLHMEKEHKVDQKVINPYLSGEVVYNLRNTFLHQGSPNVNNSKIKNVENQVDRFVLIIGDGTVIQEI